MKTLYKLFGLIVIDFGLIWVSVYQMDPDPSVSLVIFMLVPFVFILNLIVGGILFLAKKKEYSKIFFINSIMASIIMFFLFGQGIRRHQNRRLESWEFQKSDSTFSIIRWKKTNKFSMSYSLKPGSSWNFLEGTCVLKKDVWILNSDPIEMRIAGNNLIGFRNDADTIIMTKLKR